MALRCRLTVKGHLSDGWSDWLAGLTITNLSEGRAEIAGELADGAALYGVLDRLRDMGVLALSLECQETAPDGSGEAHPTPHAKRGHNDS